MLNMTDLMSLRAAALYSWLYLATSWYSLKTSLRRFNTDLLLD